MLGRFLRLCSPEIDLVALNAVGGREFGVKRTV